jgi:ABC-type uncharacterized transport system, permease component
MTRLSSTALVWRRAFHNSLADRSAYRGDFYITLIATVLSELVTPIATVLIYRSSAQSGFPGWTLAEALLIQAVFLVSRGIAYPLFFSIVWTVNGLVREGSFETVLLKPRSPLLTCMSRSVNVQAFGRLAGGLALIAWALSSLPPPSGWGALQFFVLMCASLLVLFGFALLMAGTLFVWVGNSRLPELVESILSFAQYPMSIFTSFFQIVFALIIPIAAIAYLPAAALLGRDTSLALPAVASCVAFFALSLLFWNRMLRRYSGAGG